MNVIFLDHYGVMVTSNIITLRKKFDIPSPQELKSVRFLSKFNNKCIEFINNLSAIYNFEIVISSDWTRKIKFETIIDFYHDQGVNKIPIGYVEISNGDPRKTKSKDILKFMEDNPIDNYIVIDDIFLEMENFIWCDLPHMGISNPKVQNRILEMIKTFNKSR